MTRHFVLSHGLLLGLAACLTTLEAGAAKKPKPAPPAPPAASSVAAVEIHIPKSIYKAPVNAREGRNPFFPESSVGVAPETPVKTATENYALVLNGLTGPPRRTAMINGRTFEEGETGEVKIANGSRVTVKCLKIADDSAIILVSGQHKELRLRGGI